MVTKPNFGASDPAEPQGPQQLIASPTDRDFDFDAFQRDRDRRRSDPENQRRIERNVAAPQRDRSAASPEPLPFDQVGPVAQGQRRETPEEYLGRRDLERAAKARADRLSALAEVIPDEAAGVREDIVRKIRAGEPLEDYESKLFADALAFRAQTLRLVDSIASEREREDALTEIFSGSTEVAFAVVPVGKIPKGIAAAARIGRNVERGVEAERGAAAGARAARREGGDALTKLTKAEARKLAQAFLKTKAGRIAGLAVQRSLRRELKTNAATAAAARRAARQAARQAAGRVKPTQSKLTTQRLKQAAEQAAAESQRLSSGLKAAPRELQRDANLLLRSKADLAARQRAVKAAIKNTEREIGTVIPSQRQALAAELTRLRQRDLAIGTALTLGTYAAAEAISRANRDREGQSGSEPARGTIQLPNAGPATGSSTSVSPAPSAGSSPAPGAQPEPGPGSPPGPALTTTGGPGSPPPADQPPPPKTPPPSRPPGGGGGSPRRPFNPPGDVKGKKALKVRRGTNPEAVTLRTGVIEREENLRTGKTRYGRDLSGKVSNDPKISPAESAAVTATTTQRVKFPQRRPFLSGLDLYIDKTSPTKVELALVSGRKRRKGQGKLVKSRRDV